jgi:thioredoxin-like negative regulator of GroEL
MNPSVETRGRRSLRTEFRVRWRRRPVFSIAVALLIVGLLMTLGARPAYRLARSARARNAAQRGDALLRNGQMDAAVHQLRVAYQLDPSDAVVLRTLARCSVQLGNPEAVGLHHALLDMGAAEPEDRLTAAGLFLDAGEQDSSGKLLEALTKESPTDRRVWHLALEHSRRFAGLRESITLARHVASRFPGDPEPELRLGTFLVASPRTREREEGLRLLWGVALGQSTHREPAARQLALQQGLGRPELERLARILEERADASLESRLVAAQLRVRTRPESRGEWAERVASWVGRDSPVPEVLGVVHWLERHDAMDRAGGLLALERCRTNLPLMGAHVDYLVATRQAAALEALVGSGRSVLDPAMGLAARGALRVRQGDVRGAEEAFLAAMKEPGRRDLVLPYVAREAMRAGLQTLALEAVGEWMQIPGHAAAAGRHLIELAEQLPGLGMSRELLRQLAGALPREEWVIVESGWVELLTNGNCQWAAEQFERLHALVPGEPSLGAALALARWRQGDPTGALALLEAGALDPDSMDARRRVACAVVLEANGQREAARRIIRSLPAGSLQSELEALVQPLR